MTASRKAESETEGKTEMEITARETTEKQRHRWGDRERQKHAQHNYKK